MCRYCNFDHLLDVFTDLTDFATMEPWGALGARFFGMLLNDFWKDTAAMKEAVASGDFFALGEAAADIMSQLIDTTF